jgi:hypothetical protein
MVGRDVGPAAAAGRDDTHRAAAERMERHGGRALVLSPQAEPCGDVSPGAAAPLSYSSIRRAITSRPFAPGEETTPSRSMRSIIRAARL